MDQATRRATRVWGALALIAALVLGVAYGLERERLIVSVIIVGLAMLAVTRPEAGRKEQR